MELEINQNIVIAAAAGIAAVVLLVIVVLFARRSIDRGWSQVEDSRGRLYDSLKARGHLVKQFVSVARHRLNGEREALEVLGRQQMKIVSGRNPREKANAEVELETMLERLLSVADSDPGLAGLTEYEALRQKLAQTGEDIRRAAGSYNESVERYNRQATGFFGRLFAALTAEKFEPGKIAWGRR